MYVYVVVVITELLRSRHNLRSRSGGSILSVKGLAFGVWVSELLLLLMLNRSVIRKVNLGAVLRKNRCRGEVINPMMAFIFLNVSHRRGIEMVLQL